MENAKYKTIFNNLFLMTKRRLSILRWISMVSIHNFINVEFEQCRWFFTRFWRKDGLIFLVKIWLKVFEHSRRKSSVLIQKLPKFLVDFVSFWSKRVKLASSLNLVRIGSSQVVYGLFNSKRILSYFGLFFFKLF